MQVTVRFSSIIPREGEHPDSGQRPPTSLSFPPTAREDLRLDDSLEYPMPQRHYTFTNIHAFSTAQNGDSIRTWRDVGDRAKLATNLATMLASSGLSRFFYKFVEKYTNLRPMTQAVIILEVSSASINTAVLAETVSLDSISD
ncbi:hypothetical protein TNCV_4701381 [Trichonephila clavipes]|nr:hypothetical protein TNCV_4701381 [Trichonephila clavipes]